MSSAKPIPAMHGNRAEAGTQRVAIDFPGRNAKPAKFAQSVFSV